VTAAARILDRLTGVRKTATGRWIARCPAHADKSPSLSVRELEDGRILLHDFGGCATGDVLAALGLRFADLFDKPLAHHLPPVRGGFSARELLELNAHEAMVAAMLSTKAGDGKLTEDEAARLRQAAARLAKARELTHGN
jgi:hypothetical protein